MPSAKLSGRAIRHLRALGHPLDPVLHVGKEGVTDALAAEAKRLLLTHELIKVKVQREAPDERRDAATLLADATDAVLAQVLGRTFLLYKRHPKRPKIVLPSDTKADAKGATAAKGSAARGAAAKTSASRAGSGAARGPRKEPTSRIPDTLDAKPVFEDDGVDDASDDDVFED
jgi:RNA-binding protein